MGKDPGHSKQRIRQEDLARYRAVLENIEESYFELDLAGNLTFFNESLCKATGSSSEELMGMSYRQYIPPEDAGRVFEFYHALYVTGVPAKLMNYEIIMKDGSRRVFETSASLIRNASGEPIGFRGLSRDVTERRLADENIRLAKEEWERTFDVVPDLIAIIDNNYRISRVNRAMALKLGMTPEECVGQICYRTVHGAEESPSHCPHRLLLEDGLEHTAEMNESSLGGDYLVSVSPLRDAKGNLMGSVHIARNITESKRAEQALRESEKKYRLTFNNVLDVIITTDENFHISDISPSVEKILGYKPEFFIGRPVFGLNDIFIEESFKMVLSEGASILAGEKVARSKFELLAKDGTVKHLELRASPLSQNGNIKGMVIVARDITDQTRADMELRKRESQYRQLIEQAADGIFLLNEKGKFTLINSKILEMLGYTESEIHQLDILDTYPEEIIDDGRQRFARIRAGEILRFERLMKRKDGSVFPIEASVKGLSDKTIQVIIHDITERKRAQEALDKSITNLRKALGATIQAMSIAVETRDPYTAGHQRRVADLARSIAMEMELTAEQIEGIRMAASIHDIGKISIPAEILSKPSKLTNVELQLIKTHSASGHDILKDIEFPWPIARIVLEHHERLDGSGYPSGLKGDRILIESKILAVADVVEAIASHRPYRPSLGIEAALNEITENRATLYDPDSVHACVRLFHDKDYRLAD